MRENELKKYIGYECLFWDKDIPYKKRLGILSNIHEGQYYCKEGCGNGGWRDCCKYLTNEEKQDYLKNGIQRYVIVSIKHSNEKRIIFWLPKFCDYTRDVRNAGVYSIDEVRDHYNNEASSLGFNSFEPVELTWDYLKKYKKFDSILIDESEAFEFIFKQKDA